MRLQERCYNRQEEESKTLNTKNPFSATQNRSKRTAGKMANSDTNAELAVNVLTAVSA